MHKRELQIQHFLDTHGWGGCTRTSVKGDASFRRYERLSNGRASAILMDAPPGLEDVRPFITIGKLLSLHRFSTPAIYAEDIDNGFLLLEDFGDDVYGAILSGNSPLSGSISEEELYRFAVDVLSELHTIAPSAQLPHYNQEMLLNEVMALANWYLPAIIGDTQALKTAQEEYGTLWQGILAKQYSLPEVLVLRDYHSPNLMWLPGREGIRKVGILDFQDAVAGSPAYDLVSLLTDARRDVAPGLETPLLHRYLASQPHIDKEAFLEAYAMLGVQRNLKIIGFVCRKLYNENNPGYLHIFPRMWRYLDVSLQHPAMATVKVWLDRTIPEDMRNVDTLTSRHKEQARA